MQNNILFQRNNIFSQEITNQSSHRSSLHRNLMAQPLYHTGTHRNPKISQKPYFISEILDHWRPTKGPHIMNPCLPATFAFLMQCTNFLPPSHSDILTA